MRRAADAWFARGVWAIALLLAAAADARADRLATYGAGADEVVLLNDACGTRGSRIQRATRQAGGRVLEGCWAVNGRGNPVVVWADGEVQELDESRIRLAPKYAAMLEDPAPPAGGERAAAAGEDFARPRWCKDASFPHERLICRDAELAAGDLALAPLWRAFKTEKRLSELEQAGHKSRFFRRLKACGAQKDCIAREQAERMRFYRDQLAAK
ncbi:MAG TPA: hypothetical protein VFZ93_13325 [Albitalea sp.]